MRRSDRNQIGGNGIGGELVEMIRRERRGRQRRHDSGEQYARQVNDDPLSDPAIAQGAAEFVADRSYTAINATTAANDIWKLTLRKASGRISKTTAAAQATSRIEMPRRSRITANRMSPVMMKARWVGTVDPASSR